MIVYEVNIIWTTILLCTDNSNAVEIWNNCWNYMFKYLQQKCSRFEVVFF